MFYRVSGFDKESALREVVELLRLPEEVDRSFLLRVLLAREAIASTAVGEGIAIPHVRNPVVLHVGRPSITLCFLERPIEYGALGRQAGAYSVHDCQPDHAGPPPLDVQAVVRAARSGVRGAIEAQESRQEILRQIGRAEERLVTSRAERSSTAEAGALSLNSGSS